MMRLRIVVRYHFVLRLTRRCQFAGVCLQGSEIVMGLQQHVRILGTPRQIQILRREFLRRVVLATNDVLCSQSKERVKELWSISGPLA